MKRVLVVPVIALLLAAPVRADHIGIYSDQTGTSCTLAPGFSSTATILHRFSSGASGSDFSVSAANAPGSAIFSVNSAFLTVCINPPCPFVYGGCYQSMIVGTITGMFTQGYIEVVGAHDQPTPVYMDCSGNPNPATGGRAYIGSEDVCEPLAIESSTWGRVKALYR